jgi:predicted nucleic acid-binding protein
MAVLEFDNWTAANCEAPQTISADVVVANGFVRFEDVALRASDAVHVAIAQRLGARLLTFDKKLAGNARRLGLPLA